MCWLSDRRRLLIDDAGLGFFRFRRDAKIFFRVRTDWVALSSSVHASRKEFYNNHIYNDYSVRARVNACTNCRVPVPPRTVHVRRFFTGKTSNSADRALSDTNREI